MPTILMTGGHSGIGLVGAKALVQRYGCNLILAGRDPARLERGAQQLRSETQALVETVTIDLNSLSSVREGAAKCKLLLESSARIDDELSGIVCNAGVQLHGPVTYSADGYEETFASNCLGHFLLVNLLLDSLEPDARIVWTTSGTHDPALLDGKSVGVAALPDANALARQGRTGTPISGGQRYTSSKLCVVMYAYELDRRLRRNGSQIESMAYDPGFVPDAGMGLAAPAMFRTKIVKSLLRRLGMTMGQMPLSGEALALLARDVAFAKMSGKYFHSNNGKLSEAKSSKVSYNTELAGKLWGDSRLLVQLEDRERAARISA